jgi:putative restriction endonuclease
MMRIDDTLMRIAAFELVRKLGELHDHLTATELKPGFLFDRGAHPAHQSQ